MFENLWWEHDSRVFFFGCSKGDLSSLPYIIWEFIGYRFHSGHIKEEKMFKIFTEWAPWPIQYISCNVRGCVDMSYSLSGNRTERAGDFWSKSVLLKLKTLNYLFVYVFFCGFLFCLREPSYCAQCWWQVTNDTWYLTIFFFFLLLECSYFLLLFPTFCINWEIQCLHKQDLFVWFTFAYCHIFVAFHGNIQDPRYALTKYFGLVPFI